jgi:hypothetical protein
MSQGTSETKSPPAPAPNFKGRIIRQARRFRNSLNQQRAALYYRLRSTDRGFRLLQAAEYARSPREISRRRAAARQYNERFAHPVMTAAGGWGAVTAATFDGLDDVLTICRTLFEEKYGELERGPEQRVGESRKMLAKRQFLRNILMDDDLRRYPELVDFVLSDKALGIATSYLGTVPYLNRIDLLYSTPREGEDLIKSQLFHVDPEGLTQVKFFINVFDVGDAEGPFTFLPADASARILRDIRRRRREKGMPHVGRYTDEEVDAVGGSSSIVSLKGPRGSGVSIDTSRCLHLGSRVSPGAFRLVLYVQYCTTVENGNAFDVDRYRDRPIQSLAIEHSIHATGGQLNHAPDGMAG